MTRVDVVVVGSGNAGLSAALAAREAGSSVLLLERAPVEKRGGNSVFTGGGFRFAYDTVEDITRVIPDLSENELATTDFGSYRAEEFFDDLARLTEARCDPDLAEVLVRESMSAVLWHCAHGVRFVPKYSRQAFNVDGVFRFWGGVPLGTSGAGAGLIETLARACTNAGVEIEYGARARELVMSEQGVAGIRFEKSRTVHSVECGSVILASGGFEANAEWRTRYLGPGWDLAKVRGTQFNTGDGLEMALAVGANARGQWSGCHSAAVDLNAPEYGDHRIGGNTLERHSYAMGLIINARGERFVDEGADFRTYTYARYGGEILKQPHQLAYQVFDQKAMGFLRDEYFSSPCTKVTAGTLDELSKKLEDVDPDGFIRTVTEYNSAERSSSEFDPNIKDGLSTRGLRVNKTNWAQKLDEPPYVGYAVTCGITFTYGGLRVNNSAEVLDDSGGAIPGLYATGEIMGGLHYFNYAGGSGLTAGTVFGRRAGTGASVYVRS